MRASDYVLKKPLHSPVDGGAGSGSSRKGGKSGSPTASSGRSPNIPRPSGSSSSGGKKGMSWGRFVLILGVASCFGLLLWVNVHVKATIHTTGTAGI
jgi:hypothetical protein